MTSSSRKNLSQEQIKIRILAYLYNKGDIGANSYTIQHKTLISSQESNRFKRFLQELVTLGCIGVYREETSGTTERINYRITSKGKSIVEQYRNSLLQDIFGSIEDLFR